MIESAPYLNVILNLVLGMLTVSLFLGFYRLLKGPGLPDRVVALELIATLTVGSIAAYDIATNQPILLDAATVLALIAFVGAIAFGRYIEKGASR
jgi:multicomponent Na+:H+ antiporter subunit F